ncbi:ChrR family anti-sigma-E factor [Blastochloris viridis]|nr:ChrR family anti-sigma-E factor [Blastochloris viridis]BAS00182.1 transcriptional activator chrR [Blastochloris viridis]
MSNLIEAHLELSPRNHGYLRDLDTMGGIMLAEAQPIALTGRDTWLATIMAKDTLPPSPIRLETRQPADPVLPAAIRRLVGRPLADVAWKTVLPGLKECHLGGTDGEASLLWIRAGRAMPSHSHSGLEATLVLKGGFKDVSGHYERGDIAVADETVDHKPVADDDEDCICFVVSEGHVKLTGPIGRIFSRLSGRG